MHVYAHAFPKVACACLMHTYAYTGLRTHAKVMKGSFSALSVRFGMNPTSFGSHSKPPFFNYINPYIVAFQNTTENPKEKHKIH